MVNFAFLDWFWLVAFILLMIICGILFYKLGKRSMADFFLAGRGLPWWLPASSVYATHSATDTPIWISGVVYQHGLRGIWYTFFSAWCAISTISTHLNLGASYATRDLYHHYFKPWASEKELVWVGRISTLILLLGSFLYGLMMEEITQWLIFALWIMAAGIWLPSILQVVWWRFNSWGYLSSWIANLGLSWLVVWVLPEFNVIPVLPDYLQFWIMMVLGGFIYFPITFLTPPENMDKLVKYYVMSMPLGWWKPVRQEAERRGLLKIRKKAAREVE